MPHVTYPVLKLAKITVDGHRNDERRIARLRVVSVLIKPSVEHLILRTGCPIEYMAVIEACATVTQIELDVDDLPIDFSPAFMQRALQTIATRNRQLARFRDNPSAYPIDELLALMRQFDNNPTGRYMLARCFPEIPSFFKIKTSTNSATAEPEKSTDSVSPQLGSLTWCVVQ